MRSPQNFSSVGVHRSRFKYGALGLVSIISPSFELRIAHHFFLWTPCSSRNILSKFQIFFLIDSTGPQSFSSIRVHWSMSEFRALWLVSIISLSSKLGILHHFFYGILVFRGIFCQIFKYFLNQLDRLEIGSFGSLD